jgi:hypothetical protein
MARSPVEHYDQVMVGIGFAELFQEHLQTHAIHTRQVNREALATRRIERRVEVGPLVGPPYHVRWTKAFGAITSSVPVDQPKARFVKGQNLQRFVGALAALFEPLFDLLGELLLKV